jgi:hypothetical protein
MLAVGLSPLILMVAVTRPLMNRRLRKEPR